MSRRRLRPRYAERIDSSADHSTIDGTQAGRDRRRPNLKGAKPSELPVERAERLELVINLSDREGARPTIPPSLLALADEVIQ
jgi:hypothetical protein